MLICTLGETVGVRVSSPELHKLGDLHPNILRGVGWMLRSCIKRDRIVTLPDEVFKACMTNLHEELRDKPPVIGGIQTSHKLGWAMQVDYVRSLTASVPPDADPTQSTQ